MVANNGSSKRMRTRISACCSCAWHRPKSIHVAITLFRPADMRTSLGCCIYLLAVALPVFALGDDVQLCPDATLLLPFVTSQIKQGMNLIVTVSQEARSSAMTPAPVTLPPTTITSNESSQTPALHFQFYHGQVLFPAASSTLRGWSMQPSTRG